ncbi:aldo/keto reductase [Coniella lustricola]|uniref:Aldo/keto reductase n=1 Tax=Coniella lustricola TaxID=2025994 RepID=A0A2T3AHD4_9PEZI|nr:aldo/keto reductase [Coniella lustricola]
MVFRRTSLVLGGLLLASSAAAVEDIPALGLGTWLSDRDSVPHAVEFGLKHGYDHIDAAWIYRNEDQTGKGIAAAGLPRSDIWVTSKLWNNAHRADEAHAAIHETLSRLGLAQLDLYLIHWPVAFDPANSDSRHPTLDTETSLVDTWRTLEDLVRANLTRHIGLSNFAKRDVETILHVCEICPYAHEFETHPYLQQQEFVDWHLNEAGIKVIAYSPFGNTNPIYKGHENLPPLLKDSLWVGLAEKKGATPAQVVLAWGLQRGTIVIPKSTSDEHLLENVAAQKITFTDEELELIAKHDKKARFSNPSKQWGVQLFADLDDHIEVDVVVDEL